MTKINYQGLVSSEARYRRLFETAQDGIIIMDTNTGKIYDANPFLLNMIGYSLAELKDKELWEIGFLHDKKEAKLIFEEIKKNGYVRYEDLPLENKRKEIIEAEFICNSYSVEDKMVTQCNVRDISDRIKVERLLAKRTESIEKLNSSMVGRENKMISLKKEIKHLKELNDKLVKE